MFTSRPHRALHLVDIENLIGDPLPSSAAVLQVRQHYIGRYVAPRDLVVIASNHSAFRTVGFAWSDARHLVRSGQDGADLALLGVLANEQVESRFGSVVLATGDGIFAEAAAWLAAEGVHVTVVSRHDALSRRLRLAATTTCVDDFGLANRDAA